MSYVLAVKSGISTMYLYLYQIEQVLYVSYLLAVPSVLHFHSTTNARPLEQISRRNEMRNGVAQKGSHRSLGKFEMLAKNG